MQCSIHGHTLSFPIANPMAFKYQILKIISQLWWPVPTSMFWTMLTNSVLSRMAFITIIAARFSLGKIEWSPSNSRSRAVIAADCHCNKKTIQYLHMRGESRWENVCYCSVQVRQNTVHKSIFVISFIFWESSIIIAEGEFEKTFFSSAPYTDDIRLKFTPKPIQRRQLLIAKYLHNWTTVKWCHKAGS